MATPVDFAKNRKEAEETGQIGGSAETFKVKDGSNRIRLMSECLAHPGDYKGKPTFKWLCYVIDRRDGKVKVYFMPHTIYKQIEALQVSEEYLFTTVPMPYDITINVEKAGTIDVEYSVMPARKETALTNTELNDFDAVTPLRELQKKLKEKKDKDEPQEPPPPIENDGEPVPDWAR
jgi:hypothetical protein